MHARFLALLSVSIILVSGLACGFGNKAVVKKAPAGEVQEGEVAAADPFGAVGQMQKAAAEMQKVGKELAELKPVDPVHFDKLLPIFPDDIEGFTAKDPTGETTEVASLKITTSERRYMPAEKKSKKSLRIRITDTGFAPHMLAPYRLAANFKQESTSGFNKGITLDEDPGIHTFTKTGGKSTLKLLVLKRFDIDITATGVESGYALELFQKQIGRKKFEALVEKK